MRKVDLEVPFVEKYRPKTFDEIVSQNIAIDNLKKFIKSTDIPHMIFTGPAGTGKTSTALLIAKNFLKDEEWDTNLLELNASDTVRIDYVRKVLKSFVNQNIIKNSTIKLVILDEADNIPAQVQQALRRIIEKTSNNVKFILLCNYINRIIDPIISRCAVFRFVNLSKDKIIEKLQYIVKKEHLEIPSDRADRFFTQLFFISGGDLRKAINTLQMSVALDLIENLDLNEIFKISGFLDEETLNNLVEALKTKDFLKSKGIIDSIENLDSRNLNRQLLTVLPKLNINLKQEPIFRAYLGDIDYRISQGADEKIQILALVAKLIEIIID